MQKLQDDWVFTVNDVLNSIPNKYEFEHHPQVVQESVAKQEVVNKQVYKRLRKNGQPIPKRTMPTTNQPPPMVTENIQTQNVAHKPQVTYNVQTKC